MTRRPRCAVVIVLALLGLPPLLLLDGAPAAAAATTTTTSTGTTATSATSTTVPSLGLAAWVKAFAPSLNALSQDDAAVVVLAGEHPVPVAAVKAQCGQLKADVVVAARAYAVPVKSLEAQWKALLKEARLLGVRCAAAAKGSFTSRRSTRPFNAVADSVVVSVRAMVTALVRRGAAPGQYRAAHAT